MVIFHRYVSHHRRLVMFLMPHLLQALGRVSPQLRMEQLLEVAVGAYG